MDPENLLALEVVKVICLLVIAMSLYRATQSNMEGANPASMRFAAQRDDTGSNFVGTSEAPVFYGSTDFEKINEALQMAKNIQEDPDFANMTTAQSAAYTAELNARLDAITRELAALRGRQLSTAITTNPNSSSNSSSSYTDKIDKLRQIDAISAFAGAGL